MFDRLPAPDERPFDCQPLQLATFQLDFEEERRTVPKDGLAWKKALEALGHRVPRLAPVRQRSINFQVGARVVEDPKVVAERTGWQAVLDDNVSNTALYSTAVNLERVNYPGYETFRNEILDVVDAAIDLLAPTVQQRIFLSYSNALSDEEATSVEYWRDKVRPNFFGIVANEALADGFSRSLTNASWADGDYVVDVSVALQPDQVFTGCMAFVFQIDVARKGITDMDRTELERTIDTLHETVLKVFYSVLEPQYVTILRKST